jgi:carboxymethylenebutenolidase
MKYLVLLVLLLTACTAPVNTQSETDELPVEQNMVAYYGNVQGYYAAPTTQGDYPGVVLIHEWWGLNDQMKQTAGSLAARGYRVLAVDLYNGKVATTQDEAKTLVGSVERTEALANMQAAVSYLQEKGSPKIATWGYCFGGGQSANYALSGSDIDATVIYYGTVPTDAASAANVSAPVFMVYGDQDTSTPAASAQQFKEALDAKGVQAELHVYPGVGHAFANPSNPGHDVEKTQDAWEKTLAFLDKELR